MSESVANELYDISHDRVYDSFMDVLYVLDHRSSINSRQIDILIKIDFFSCFGNQRELLTIYDLYNRMFKNGEAKQIKRDIVDGTPMEPIIRRHSVWVTKTGKEAKSYTITDMMPLLHEVETFVKSAHMDDLEDRIKIKNFQDLMGYIGYSSGREEDRRKLYILDIYPLKRKKDGKQFGYSVITKSVGSGKEARFTIFNRVFDKEPIRKGDIILCKGWQRDGQYFTMTAYQKEI